MLSTKCTYGLRAALYLASGSDGKFISTEEISRNLEIPRHFLSKVLLQLTKEKILVSLRGAKGGVALARSPQTISIMEILNALGTETPISGCLLGRPSCCSSEACILSDEVGRVGPFLNDALTNTTLAHAASRLTAAERVEEQSG